METWELDWVEYHTALYAGVLLYALSRKQGLKDGTVTPRLSALYITKIGQVAERVAAKALDLYWSSAANTFKAPDLSHNIEVRATRRMGQGVKVRKQDDDTKRVLGVLVEDGKEEGPYTLLGWLYAADGKRSEWSKAPYGGPPYYEVPLSELRPVATLRELVYREKADMAGGGSAGDGG